MANKKRTNNIPPVILAVIVTAVVVGAGAYYWQTFWVTVPIVANESKVLEETSAESEKLPKISQTKEIDYTLSINQDTKGASSVTLRDAFSEGSGFSMRFPSSWGFVSVERRSLTDCGFGCNPAQIASYKFTSEFRPYTHYLKVIISLAERKDGLIVTQQNRIHLAEDDTYYYNYNPSTQFCIDDGKCKDDEVEAIDAEIKEIVDSFKLL